MPRARFTFTYADFADLSRARAERTGCSGWSGLLKVFGYYLVCVTLGVVVGMLMSDGLAGLSPDRLLSALQATYPALTFIIFALVVLHFYVVGPAYRAYVHYPKLSVAGKEMTYEFADSGLGWTSPAGKGEITWTAVEAVSDLPRSFVVWIGRLEGAVVPARAFATTADYRAAREVVRARAGK